MTETGTSENEIKDVVFQQIRKEVKRCGTGGHILMKKAQVGENFYIIPEKDKELWFRIIRNVEVKK